MQCVNHRVSVFTALAALLVASSASMAGAQVAYDAPRARVEVLGLHHWTLQTLQDSIRHRVPGQTLANAACMVTLRDSLHFADALVNDVTFADGPGTPARHYLVIKVIEPRDSALVRWRPAPRDSFTVLRPAYAPIVIPATDSLGRLWMARLLAPLQLYTRAPAERAVAVQRWSESAQQDAQRLWSFLDAHRSEGDRRTAMAALRNDGSYINRVVAAAVLTNFAGQDSTWWALTDALRDGNEAVRTTALTVLRELPERPVNWMPVASALRALLGGTNVAATQDVLELLSRTDVSPALARPLLRDNANWLRMHLRAEYPGASASAHALLVRLNDGRDLGGSDAAWAHWFATL